MLTMSRTTHMAGEVEAISPFDSCLQSRLSLEVSGCSYVIQKHPLTWDLMVLWDTPIFRLYLDVLSLLCCVGGLPTHCIGHLPQSPGLMAPPFVSLTCRLARSHCFQTVYVFVFLLNQIFVCYKPLQCCLCYNYLFTDPVESFCSFSSAFNRPTYCSESH